MPRRLILFHSLFSLLFAATIAHAQEAGAKSLVCSVRSDGACANYEPDSAVIQRMVNDVVMAVTGAGDAAAAWKSLVKPADRVGVKIADTGGWRSPLHGAVADAVLTGLQSAGVPRSRIVVWSGAHSRGDHDPKAVFSSPLMGKLIWGDVAFSGKPEKDESNESHWHRLLGEKGGLTKIINVATLAAHESIGMAGALYNVTIPNIDNWRRFTTGPGAADPYVCEMFADGRAGPKVALNFLDGLCAQFADGPESGPNQGFEHKTIYASRDAVALDATAFRLVEKWRKEAKLPPLGDRAAYLQTAAAMNLGNFDEAQIELREVK